MTVKTRMMTGRFKRIFTFSCPTIAINFGMIMMDKKINRFLKQILYSMLLVAMTTQASFAAGPRAKDIYVKMGAGIMTPTFKMKEGELYGVDGPPLGTDNTLVGGGNVLVNVHGASDNLENRIENKQILALGGGAGYQINPYLGVELHLNVGFPNIAVRDIYVDDLVAEGKETAGTVHILTPHLLPVGATVTFSPLPNAFVSPYVGAGGILALLNNRRAGSPATDLITWDGAPSLGIMFQAGAYMDINKDWFAFVDIMYGYVDEPDIEGKDGEPVAVEFFDFRHFSVGAGMRF